MACLHFRKVISKGLTMLTCLISSSMDFLIAFIYMVRSIVYCATCACISIFGLHPPCFHPGVLRLRAGMSESSQYSRHIPSTHLKSYKKTLGKRKLNELWVMEGIHKSLSATCSGYISEVVEAMSSHSAVCTGNISGGIEATRSQVQRINSFKVFPEDLIKYHAIPEHQSIMKYNCDTIDHVTDVIIADCRAGVAIVSKKVPADHAKDVTNVTMQTLVKRDCICERGSQLLIELQETDVRSIDGAALVSDIGLDSVKEHVRKNLDVYVHTPPRSHGLQEIDAKPTDGAALVYGIGIGLDAEKEHVENVHTLAHSPFHEIDARPTHGIALVSDIDLDSAKEPVRNKLDVDVHKPPDCHGSPEIQEETGTQKPESVAHEVDADKMPQGMPCELLRKLKEKLSLVRQTLHMVHAQLERQRAASSVAAQESMATISMLQREKAALLLEAMQHQRMAEEKEMFDENAVIDLRDSLVKREAELLALEKELELYRREILKGQFEGIEKSQASNGVINEEANILKHFILEYPGTEIGQYTNTTREPCNTSICPPLFPCEETRDSVHPTHKIWRVLSQESPPDLRSRSMIVRDTSRVILKIEASELLSRLRAVEADRELVRQTIELRRKERWEMQVLVEVAGSLKLLHSSNEQRSVIGGKVRLRRACSVSAVEAEIFRPKRPRFMNSDDTSIISKRVS